MDGKMIEAGTIAFWKAQQTALANCSQVSCPSDHISEGVSAALSAALDAAMGDEGVVEKMARAMLADELKSKPRADFDAIWPEEDLIWLSNARAALAALKGDAP